LSLSIHVTAHSYNLTIEYMRDPKNTGNIVHHVKGHVLEEYLKEKKRAKG